MLFPCSQSAQLFESGHSKEAAVMKRALDLGHQETWVRTQNPSSATLSPILSSVRWVLRSKELVFSLRNSINSRGLYKYYLPCCCYHSLTWFGLFFKEARETMRFATAINRSWVVKTKGQLLLGLAGKNPIAETLSIGSNPATVTEVIVKWYGYCQYNHCDRIVFGAR